MAKNLIFFWAPYGFGFALDGLGLGGVRFRVDLCGVWVERDEGIGSVSKEIPI